MDVGMELGKQVGNEVGKDVGKEVRTELEMQVGEAASCTRGADTEWIYEANCARRLQFNESI